MDWRVSPDIKLYWCTKINCVAAGNRAWFIPGNILHSYTVDKDKKNALLSKIVMTCCSISVQCQVYHQAILLIVDTIVKPSR